MDLLSRLCYDQLPCIMALLYVDLLICLFLSTCVHHGTSLRGSVDLSVFLSNAVHHGPTSRDLLICLCSYQMLCIMALRLVNC